MVSPARVVFATLLVFVVLRVIFVGHGSSKSLPLSAKDAGHDGFLHARSSHVTARRTSQGGDNDKDGKDSSSGDRRGSSSRAGSHDRGGSSKKRGSSRGSEGSSRRQAGKGSGHSTPAPAASTPASATAAASINGSIATSDSPDEDSDRITTETLDGSWEGDEGEDDGVHGPDYWEGDDDSEESARLQELAVIAARAAAGARHGKHGGAAGGGGAAVGPRSRPENGASWDVLDNVKRMTEHTPLVTHKRQFITHNATLGHDVVRHWLSYWDGNNTLIYNFPKGLFELLPLNEPRFHFESCAVVGNSGVLLLKQNGQDIDSHDAVIRLNMAPVRGYEQYVGRRTTFNVVNSHNIKSLIAGKLRWRVTPGNEGSHLVVFETSGRPTRYHLCQPLLRHVPQAKPLLLNPVFANRAHRLWVQVKYLLEQEGHGEKKYNRKPMSGYFATIFSLQVCDRVDLYGFDAYTSKRRSYRYHYFDDVQGFTGVHSFDLAMEVFKLLSQKYDLQIIT
eukprot:jgi/Mesvir1/25054/Mv11898-RA.1